MNVFFCLISPFMLYNIVFSFWNLVMATLSKRGDRENCHDTSVVTSHVDHVVGFGVFVVSQVSSLGFYVVDVFLITFWRNESRLFLWCFSVHRVECCVSLKHQPMFHPITSFVSLVECVSANTYAFGTVTKSQLCIEVSSNYKYVCFCNFSCVSRSSCTFFRCDGPHILNGWSTHSSIWCVGNLPRSWRWWPVRWCMQSRWLFASTSCSS